MKTNWKPGNNIVIVFNDTSREERTKEQLKNMVEEVQVVVNKYNFNMESFSGDEKLYNNFVFKNMFHSLVDKLID